jgi:hypothetical protein
MFRHDRVLWALLLIAPMSQAAFSRHKPWCESYFSRESALIRTFREQMESVRAKSKKERSSWGGPLTQISYRRKLYRILALMRAERLLNAEPYTEMNSSARAILISWTLAKFGAGSVPLLSADRWTAIDCLENFWKAVVSPAQFSDEDRQRIYLSAQIYLRGLSDSREQNRSKLLQLDLDLQKWLAKSQNIDEKLLTWDREISRVIVAGSPAFKGAVVQLAKNSAEILQKLKPPTSDVVTALMQWTRDLSRLNEVHWDEALNTFLVLRDCARDMEVTETDFSKIREVFMNLVVATWKNMDRARLVAESRAAAGLHPVALPE